MNIFLTFPFADLVQSWYRRSKKNDFKNLKIFYSLKIKNISSQKTYD